MTSEQCKLLWDRVRAGRHVALVGRATIPPVPSDLKAIRVDCAASSTTGGVLGEVHRKVAQLLGSDWPAPDPAIDPPAAGPQHRLIGSLPARSMETALVAELNQLAAWSDARAVLCLEAVDGADAAAADTLVHILDRPDWLRLPLILTVHDTPRGAVAKLVEVLRRHGGAEAIMEIGEEMPAGNPPVIFDALSLPAEVLRVLRAATVAGGATFEADLVARLLDESPGTVLEGLQRAADAGVPLADRGEGRFSLPGEVVEGLQSRMLPSLLTYWHERLGELLSGVRQAEPVVEGRRQDRTGMQGAGETGLRPAAAPEAPEAPGAPGAPGAQGAPGGEAAELAGWEDRSPTTYAELFEPPAPSPEEPETLPPRGEPAHAASGADSAPATAAPWRPRDASTAMSGPRRDSAQAAAHLQAAGRAEAAAQQYLAAVREVAAAGDARRAHDLAREALKLLDGLPVSNRRALLRAQLLLELGRIQWQAAVLGTAFTLQSALESLQAAKAQLPADAAPEVLGELAAVTAGVCYDLGDLDSLEGALEGLADVSRRLLAMGQPLLAARLLNEQAAIWLRLGDPVRATHLLSKSRELFQGRLRDDPDDRTALDELGQSDHLMARLLLHAQIRPGREQDAYAIAREHALAAERTYQRLERPRQLARVWETMGRLELAQGKLDAAGKRLTAALDLQKKVDDLTGLARSTAALAQLMTVSGRLEAAAALLTDSISLNFEKGSPIGLAFNRRALETLSRSIDRPYGPGGERLRAALAEMEGRLAQAESVLGRLTLPGES
jgi:tetratricopeptide (TPR) repeat protein